MKKELIIIVYRINVEGLTRQQAELQIHAFMESYNMRNDPELIDDYIIREIWLPTQDGISDVKIIYPISKYSRSVELDELVDEITKKIDKNPNGTLTKNWERLVRELKLSKINLNSE
jgi:hypothetical protein